MNPEKAVRRYAKNMELVVPHCINRSKNIQKFIQTANNHENNDEKGVDIYTIQKVMGHSDISVTAGTYVHNDIEVLRKQLKIDD